MADLFTLGRVFVDSPKWPETGGNPPEMSDLGGDEPIKLIFWLAEGKNPALKGAII